MEQSRYPSFTVILVDDETEFLNSATIALRRDGITNVEAIADSRQVMDRVARGGCGVLVLDLTMPYVSGKEILEQVAKEFPEIFVFIVTAVNDLQSAVDCMKLGARDYIVKPLQQDQLLGAIRRAIESKLLEAETASLKNSLLENSLKHPEAFSSIHTNSAAMNNLFKYVEVIAPSDLPVLITGETGTGKELMAEAIHALSGRKGKYVCVNIAGIDDIVLSDTLFGHVRGAFTGAERSRKGLIEEAAQGTVFLDEIGDLRPESQTKLLRLLQEGTFHPVGSDSATLSSARVIAATNRDLKTLLRTGEFRADLYYRLQAHEVRLPALRERLEDLRILAPIFIEEGCRKLGIPVPHIKPELFSLLATYAWPGNIRELRGLMVDTVSRNDTDTLSFKYLKEKLRELRNEPVDETELDKPGSHPLDTRVSFSSSLPTMEEMELMLIQEALRRTNGNRTQAADLIGLARATVIKRLKES
ncbi:MAG TPA: sigma-54 dependent transcriptional regulator [Bacteroidota bacterium]|nr:sigma-54 dependent transcriptional regulator [Bacteroidota bacterium]